MNHFRRVCELEPQNPSAAVELGMALHRHHGQAEREEAITVLDRAFALADPPKGVGTTIAAEFHTQLGLRLRPELPQYARRHFEASLALDPGHSQARTAIYHLGRIMRIGAAQRTHASQRASDREAEHGLYRAAVSRGLWKHPMQRPGYLASGVATAAGPWPVAADWPQIADAMQRLEAGYATILAELRGSIRTATASSAGGSGSHSIGAAWGVQDLEGLTDSGQWFQRIYRRNGVLHPDAHDATRGGCAFSLQSTTYIHSCSVSD